MKKILKKIKNLLRFKKNPQVFKQRELAEKIFDEQIFFKKYLNLSNI